MTPTSSTLTATSASMSCRLTCESWVVWHAGAPLSIVPVVPWEGAPAASPPPINCPFFATLCWRSLTTKKGRQLFGRRKVHPERENPGYAYEKMALGLRWYGAPKWLIRPCWHMFSLESSHYWHTYQYWLIVHRTRLSTMATEPPSPSPQLVFGTVCCSMLRLQCTVSLHQPPKDTL